MIVLPPCKFLYSLLLATILLAGHVAMAADNYKDIYAQAHKLSDTDIPGAIDLLKQAAKLAHQAKDKKALGNCYYLMGYCYDFSGDVANAANFYLASIRINQELGNRATLHELYENLGTLSQNSGAHDISLRFYQQSLEYAREIDSREQIADSHFDVALAFKGIGSHDSSMTHLITSLDFYLGENSLKDSVRKAEIYKEMGIILQKLAFVTGKDTDIEAAKEKYFKSLNTDESLASRAQIYTNLGSLYLDQGQNEKAVGYLKSAYQIKKEIGSGNFLVTTLCYLGIAHYRNLETDSSYHYFTEAINQSLVNSSKDRDLRISLNRSNEVATAYLYIDSLRSLDSRYRLDDQVMTRYMAQSIDNRTTLENAESVSHLRRLVYEHEMTLLREQYQERMTLFMYVAGPVILLLLAFLAKVLYQKWAARQEIREAMIDIENKHLI